MDAVYVATPPDSHLHYTKLAAAAGKPVLVEKPMARSYAECQQMIDACAAGGRAAVGRLLSPPPAPLPENQALVDTGAIGDVRTVSVTLRQRPLAITDDLPWRVQPAISGGGLFADVAVHMLDYPGLSAGTDRGDARVRRQSGGAVPGRGQRRRQLRLRERRDGGRIVVLHQRRRARPDGDRRQQGTLTYATFDAAADHPDDGRRRRSRSPSTTRRTCISR